MSQAGVNWRAGVTTMEADAEVRGGDDQLLGGGFTSNVNTLRTLVTSVGTGEGDARVRDACAAPEPQRASEDARDGSAFRLRRDVPVAFIVLTDTEDQSVRQQAAGRPTPTVTDDPDDADCVDRAIQPTARPATRRDGRHRGAARARPPGARVCDHQPPERCVSGSRELRMGLQVAPWKRAGSVGNICGANLDYTELLRRMGEQAINVLLEAHDDGRALIESSIQITAGSEDARITRDPTLWRMDASFHRLRLLDAAAGAGTAAWLFGSIWTTP